MKERNNNERLFDFQKAFSTEEACENHLRQTRWPDGFRCPHCGHSEAWFIRTRKILDCKSCRKKVSLTAGTIFHKTRTPLVKWYQLIYRMATHKTACLSIRKMQSVLGIADYKTVWMMAHKVRKAMTSKIPGQSLAGFVLVDASFFDTAFRRKDTEGGENIKVLCAITVSSKERPFIHMTLVQKSSHKILKTFLQEIGYRSETMEGKKAFDALLEYRWQFSALLNNKMYAAYAKLFVNENVIRNKKLAEFALALFHSLPIEIHSEHNRISKKYFQPYFNEICFRYNHRYWPENLFDQLLKACLTTEPETYSDIVKR